MLYEVITQYTHARIQSILRKAAETGAQATFTPAANTVITAKEKSLLKLIHEFPTVVQEAAKNLSPALVANYAFELAKEYNQFYHDHIIVQETDVSTRAFRLALTQTCGQVIKTAIV